jgi:hypothetical protein
VHKVHWSRRQRVQKYFGTVEGEKVKTVPQGYARDHPEIESLRFKQMVLLHQVSDEMVLSPTFSIHVIKTSQP